MVAPVVAILVVYVSLFANIAKNSRGNIALDFVGSVPNWMTKGTQLGWFGLHSRWIWLVLHSRLLLQLKGLNDLGFELNKFGIKSSDFLLLLRYSLLF